MRNIETRIVEALRGREEMRDGPGYGSAEHRDEVFTGWDEVYGPYAVYILHGSKVAEVGFREGKPFRLTVWTTAWRSRLTAGRIKAIMKGFGIDATLIVEKGVWSWSDRAKVEPLVGNVERTWEVP